MSSPSYPHVLPSSRLPDLGWAIGDLIAGLTVGLVLVPQSMSYAKIANLPPQYGLYSSFVGVFIYCVRE